jgi:hypothetical protein
LTSGERGFFALSGDAEVTVAAVGGGGRDVVVVLLLADEGNEGYFDKLWNEYFLLEKK